jgi:hypothetical protein
MAAKDITVKKYVVKLSEAERSHLQGLINKGKSPAKRLLKARILLKADAGALGEGWSDGRIVEALDTNMSMVTRVSTVGCHAVPLDLCLRSVLSGHSAKLTSFRAHLFSNYRQHQGRRRKRTDRSCQTTRLASRLNLHSAPLLPAVSFLGAFRRRPGRRRPARIHPAVI